VCGPGARPETGIQGVSLADYTSGRAARGYQCNSVMVSHQGTNGGFKTLRYRDPAGHVCAFCSPKDVLCYAADLVMPNSAGSWAVDGSVGRHSAEIHEGLTTAPRVTSTDRRRTGGLVRTALPRPSDSGRRPGGARLRTGWSSYLALQ